MRYIPALDPNRYQAGMKFSKKIQYQYSWYPPPNTAQYTHMLEMQAPNLQQNRYEGMMPIRSLKPESGAHGWMKTEWGESRGSILLNQGKFFLYLAPATNVWSLSASLWKSRARPKSAILGLRFLSRRMLIALMSEWMRCASILVWRWASPCAVPNAMLNRLFHSSFMPFAGSVKWTHQWGRSSLDLHMCSQLHQNPDALHFYLQHWLQTKETFQGFV